MSGYESCGAGWLDGHKGEVTRAARQRYHDEDGTCRMKDSPRDIERWTDTKTSQTYEQGDRQTDREVG